MNVSKKYNDKEYLQNHDLWNCYLNGTISYGDVSMTCIDKHHSISTNTNSLHV